MPNHKHLITSLPLVPLAGAVFIASQVLKAAHRTDLPSFPNQDPSGTFGDDHLPPLRIVAMGDSSITAPGIDHLDDVWIRQVVNRFTDRHHVELISLAVGGSKARDVIEGQLAEAVRLRPDIAVVSVGGNDAIRAVSASRFLRELSHIVERFAEICPVIIYGIGDLGSIPRLPPSLRILLTRRSQLFDDIAQEVATARPHVIKVWTRGKLTTAFWEDDTLFGRDRFHAGEGGHTVFAEGAIPAFDAAYAMTKAAGPRVARTGP